MAQKNMAKFSTLSNALFTQDKMVLHFDLISKQSFFSQLTQFNDVMSASICMKTQTIKI